MVGVECNQAFTFEFLSSGHAFNCCNYISPGATWLCHSVTELEGELAPCGVGSEELGIGLAVHSGTELESGTWQISSLSPRPYHPRFSALPLVPELPVQGLLRTRQVQAKAAWKNGVDLPG